MKPSPTSSSSSAQLWKRTADEIEKPASLDVVLLHLLRISKPKEDGQYGRELTGEAAELTLKSRAWIMGV